MTFSTMFMPTSDMSPTIAHDSDVFFLDHFRDVDSGDCAKELCIFKLSEESFDEAIIGYLGDSKRAEVTLADFWAALAKKEAAGNSVSLIAYVKDREGSLLSILAYWHKSGWGLLAFPTTLPLPWYAGIEVLACNPISN